MHLETSNNQHSATKELLLHYQNVKNSIGKQRHVRTADVMLSSTRLGIRGMMYCGRKAAILYQSSDGIGSWVGSID